MIRIHEVSAPDVPMSQLRLADPSEQRIQSYVGGSRVFVADVGNQVAGALVLRSHSPDQAEIMNIAVLLDLQRQSIGAKLIDFVATRVKELGLEKLTVGPATLVLES